MGRRSRRTWAGRFGRSVRAASVSDRFCFSKAFHRALTLPALYDLPSPAHPISRASRARCRCDDQAQSAAWAEYGLWAVPQLLAVAAGGAGEGVGGEGGAADPDAVALEVGGVVGASRH